MKLVTDTDTPPTSMQFRVDPFDFTVTIPAHPLKHHGERVEGLVDEQGRSIHICRSVPPEQRLHVLAHELRHLWQWFYGTPHDAEGDANAVATFTCSLIHQLNRQGGEAALIAMQPVQTAGRKAVARG